MSHENKVGIKLFGHAGSGKSTLVKVGLEGQGIGHGCLGTGNRCRDEIDRGTEIGHEIQSYISAGLHVPDPIILELAEDELKKIIHHPIIVLDGFPEKNFPNEKGLQHARSLRL